MQASRKVNWKNSFNCSPGSMAMRRLVLLRTIKPNVKIVRAVMERAKVVFLGQSSKGFK